MREHNQDLKRREFLKAGVVAATAALGAGGVRAEGKPADSGIPTRPFGKTGLRLPVFGMGGSAFVDMSKFGGYGVKLLPVEERVAMVRLAYDKGIRYFDTARVYLDSESIVGKALKGVRDNVFLATKVAVADPAQVQKSLETSFKELGVDRVDLVQIHSPAIERVGFDGAMKLHAELVRLRDQKLFKYIGLTTHVAFETVHKLIGTGGFDQVLLAYGYFRKGLDTLHSNRNIEFRDLCVSKAHDLKMAIVAMKVFGASILGHNSANIVPGYDKDALARLPAAAIRWTYQDERVSVLNLGVSLPEDVDKNIAVLKGDAKFTNEDRMLLADFCGKAYESEAVKKLRTV